jgi:hypothetical protein
MTINDYLNKKKDYLNKKKEFEFPTINESMYLLNLNLDNPCCLISNDHRYPNYMNGEYPTT